MSGVAQDTVEPQSSLWQALDSGFLAWNYDGSYANSSTALTPAGTLFTAAIKLLAPIRVTNVIFRIDTAGATLTSGQCFAALYQGAGGTLIGATADQSAAWVSSGLKIMALSGGPFTVQAGTVYVAFYYNGTTGPTLLRGTSKADVNDNLTSSNFRCATANTGLTTAAPGTLGTMTAASNNYWVALS